MHSCSSLMFSPGLENWLCIYKCICFTPRIPLEILGMIVKHTCFSLPGLVIPDCPDHRPFRIEDGGSCTKTLLLDFDRIQEH